MNVDRIELLKYKGFTPVRILDIGCHVGVFAGEMQRVWPSVDLFLIDANPYLEDELKKLNIPYKICLLGQENKSSVDFYVTKKWLLSSGNSVYRENTEDYSDPFISTIQLDMHRLDDLFPGEVFNFIKMDTQGSEVDIMCGGESLISRADYVQVECSILEYNQGGAKIFDVFKKMDSLGFRMIDIADLFYKEEDLCQIDVLFRKVV